MSCPTEEVVDPGLQAERTALAWERTALSLAAGATALGRVVAEPLGPVAAVLALAGLVLAGAVAGTARRRYRRMHCSLVARGDLTGARSGWAIAALTCSTLTVGVLAVAFVASA